MQQTDWGICSLIYGGICQCLFPKHADLLNICYETCVINRWLPAKWSLSADAGILQFCSPYILMLYAHVIRTMADWLTDRSELSDLNWPEGHTDCSPNWLKLHCSINRPIQMWYKYCPVIQHPRQVACCLGLLWTEQHT